MDPGYKAVTAQGWGCGRASAATDQPATHVEDRGNALTVTGEVSRGTVPASGIRPGIWHPGIYSRVQSRHLGAVAASGIYSQPRHCPGIWHPSRHGIWHLFPGAVADGVDNIKELTPNASRGAIGAAAITCNADGQFSAGLTRTGTFMLDLPAVCMRARTGPIGQLDPTIRRRARATCASSSRYRYALPTLAKALTATPPASLTRRIRSAPTAVSRDRDRRQQLDRSTSCTSRAAPSPRKSRSASHVLQPGQLARAHRRRRLVLLQLRTGLRTLSLALVLGGWAARTNETVPGLRRQERRLGDLADEVRHGALDGVVVAAVLVAEVERTDDERIELEAASDLSRCQDSFAESARFGCAFQLLD